MPIAVDDVPVESSVNLLVRAQTGDASALDALVVRYLPRVRRWARHRIPDGARAMLDSCDVAQDAVINMLKHVHSIEIRHPRSVHAYLQRAVGNRIVDLYRHVKVRGISQEPPESIPSRSILPDQAAIGAETMSRYERALRRLRDVDRRAVVMRIEMEQSYAEIARAINKPTPGAARIAVARALAKLAQEMRSGQKT